MQYKLIILQSNEIFSIQMEIIQLNTRRIYTVQMKKIYNTNEIIQCKCK